MHHGDAIDLSRSVIAVPPLARRADLRISKEENRRLVQHLRAGGVTYLLYGGNANFYNIGLYEYAEVLDTLAEIAPDDMALVPSAGPEYGRLMDQAPILKQRKFPTVMVLPASAASTPTGAVKALQDFAERLGQRIVVYLKSENYLRPADVARLVDAGVVSWIKYAIVREDARKDAFLNELLDRVDRKYVVSGIGELPAVAHLERFGLAAFTSGSVCVAPALSTRLLQALLRKEGAAARELQAAFVELEGLRNRVSPVMVLHEAVTLAGIGDMGPVLPLLDNLGEELRPQVRDAALRLLAHNDKVAQLAA